MKGGTREGHVKNVNILSKVDSNNMCELFEEEEDDDYDEDKSACNATIEEIKTNKESKNRNNNKGMHKEIHTKIATINKKRNCNKIIYIY